MGNTVPHFTNQYSLFVAGELIDGHTQVTLPSLQAVTQEIKGAGIHGSMNVPVRGHFQPYQVTITFRAPVDNITKLLEQDYKDFELWAATQTGDKASGEIQAKQQKVIIRGVPTNINLGTFSPGEIQNIEITFEDCYLKWVYDGKDILELDKFNGVYKVNDVDLTSQIRAAIDI